MRTVKWLRRCAALVAVAVAALTLVSVWVAMYWGPWAAVVLAAIAGLASSWFLFRALRPILVRDRGVEEENMRLLSQMRSMLEHATVGLVITVDRKMVIISRAFWTLFGYEENEMLGQPGRLIYPTDEVYAELGPRVGAAFAQSGQFETEIQLIRKNKSVFWCQLMGRPVDPTNLSAGTMWVIYDISEMRAQREQLEWTSSHDSLTGLFNRAAFERALDGLLDERRIDASDRSGSVILMLDLDHFKQVNDTSGHAAGDQLLRDISELMTSNLRQGDLLARLGGDEFAILLSNCDGPNAVTVAEAVCKRVRDYRLIRDGVTHSVSVSIGLLPIQPGLGSRESVLERVDAACYEAKKGGRDRVCAAQVHGNS